MKKMLPFLLFTLVLFYNGFGQHRVHLSIGYLPGHSYTEKTDQIINMEIEFTGNAEEVKKLSGGENPVKKTVISHSEKETKTGKLYKDSLFAIKSVITKMQSMDRSGPIPPGSTIYSTGSTSGRTTVDSMSAEGMDPELKEKLFPLLKGVMQQVIIPKHTLKIGEAFTFQNPVTIPVAGMNLDLVLNTTFKLKTVSGTIAYFDISQTFVMQSESVAMPANATGTGKGSMSYDMDNNYFTLYEIKSTINMSMNSEGKGMKMKIESTNIQKVEIEAN